MDGVSVVLQDGVDQVLSDVVDVSVDRGQDDGALALVFPDFSRKPSSCLTARFITSADWSTKGRIRSPEPKRSPTSFMAGRRTSFSVLTAPS